MIDVCDSLWVVHSAQMDGLKVKLQTELEGGGLIRRIWFCCHVAFFGVGQMVGTEGAVGEIDAVESLDEGVEGLLTTVGFELTFPNGDAVPTHGGNLMLLFDVTLFVTLDFLFPKRSVGLWHFETLAVVVSVPKASVDEDYRAVFLEHDVGMAGQTGMVEAIAEATGKEILSHQYLRACPLALYGSHAAVALLLGHLVHSGIMEMGVRQCVATPLTPKKSYALYSCHDLIFMSLSDIEQKASMNAFASRTLVIKGMLWSMAPRRMR